MASSEDLPTMWGHSAELWAVHTAKRAGVPSVSARFCATDAEWLREQMAGGVGRLVRASDGALVADFGSDKTAEVPDSQLLDLSDPWQRALAKRRLREVIVRDWVGFGVEFDDVEQVWIDATVQLAAGVRVGPCVVLSGSTTVASGARIDLGAALHDTRVEANAHIKAHTVTTGAIVGPEVAVGPLAHLRQGAVLHRGCKVGNFVEVKKSELMSGCKVSHLTYVGDAEIGPGANIGAGTITCNYDGYGKHRTVVGAGAFVGSNSSLVAPVQIGANSIIGAGSVVTQDVPADALAVERSPMRTLEGRAPRIRASNARRAGKTP